MSPLDLASRFSVTHTTGKCTLSGKDRQGTLRLSRENVPDDGTDIIIQADDGETLTLDKIEGTLENGRLVIDGRHGTLKTSGERLVVGTNEIGDPVYHEEKPTVVLEMDAFEVLILGNGGTTDNYGRPGVTKAKKSADKPITLFADQLRDYIDKLSIVVLTRIPLDFHQYVEAGGGQH